MRQGDVVNDNISFTRPQNGYASLFPWKIGTTGSGAKRVGEILWRYRFPQEENHLSIDCGGEAGEKIWCTMEPSHYSNRSHRLTCPAKKCKFLEERSFVLTHALPKDCTRPLVGNEGGVLWQISTKI